MIGLAAKTAAAVFALWGMAFLILDAREKREEGTSRAWVYSLADRSRGRKALTARRACRYVEAGWRPETHRMNRG